MTDEDVIEIVLNPLFQLPHDFKLRPVQLQVPYLVPKLGFEHKILHQTFVNLLLLEIFDVDVFAYLDNVDLASHCGPHTCFGHQLLRGLSQLVDIWVYINADVV